jgi:hypothetical protein
MQPLSITEKSRECGGDMTWGRNYKFKGWPYIVAFLIFAFILIFITGEKPKWVFIIIGIFLAGLIFNEVFYELWFWLVKKVRSFFEER